MLRRFDEILCEKCSRTTLFATRNELEKRYDPQLVTMKEVSSNIQSEIDNLKVTMEVLESEVETRCERTIDKFLLDREKIHDQFDKDPHI